MKKEELEKAFNMIQEMQKFEQEVKNILNIDIFEVPYFENFYRMFELLIHSNYTSKGQDWIYWWCYENDFGKAGLGATDENGNPICTNFDELYEYVKQYEC